jgi:cobalt-zinc-cadmium efflux system membrane fusion protein
MNALHCSACPLLPGLLILIASSAGCSGPPGQSAPPPAAEKPRVESDLSQTTLSRPARKSLGIQSEVVRSQPVQEQVQLTGWVMARQGHEVTITAPVGGYIRAPFPPAASDAGPVAGLAVTRDQELLLLEPVLSPVEQIQIATLKRGVEGELAKARENVTIANLDLQRIEGLHKQGLRQKQDVEQAQGRLANAKVDLAAAEAKLALFAASKGDDNSALLKIVPVRAPLAGTVLNVHVSPGQYVPAAAPLVTVADLSLLWVRVPIPENDLPRVARKEAAEVSLKSANNASDKARAQALTAQPVAIVPQVDLTRHTADLIYELPPNAAEHGILAKDQMVTVSVPLGGRRTETVVPYSAVVFDAYAGAWIYLDRNTDNSPQCVYERRRVELGPRVNDRIVIRPAVKAGERVVTAGAAALFSREFHKPPVSH